VATLPTAMSGPHQPSPFRAYILALMVTRRCNMTCAHCSVESGPHIRIEPTVDELRQRIDAAADAGVHLVLFTGGEPMLREADLLELIRHARRRGLNSSVVTNGFWGGTPAKAQRTVRRLKRAGIVSFTISPDRYHAPFQAIDHSLHIVRAARAERVTLNVNLTRTQDDGDLDATVSAFEREPAAKGFAHLRFYDVQPVGRGRRLQSLRAENEGACAACRLPGLTDDGRVTACNGPSYFAPADSPLNVGRLADHSLSELLGRHARDPILDTIRTFGVSRLRDELLQIPGFETLPLRPAYRGMCELCLDLTSNAPAVAALRERLSGERFAAERHATWLVRAAGVQDGPANFVALNSTQRARVFWPVLRGGAWADDADRTLGRADLNWTRAAEYFASCGLAGRLAPRLGDREISRWAPPFFAERLQHRAMADTLRGFVVRELLSVLNEALEEIDADGVLLKGAGMIAKANGEAAARAAGDLDIWVPAAHAEPLRTRLIERGFDGRPGERRTAAHHLAHVTFRGVPVEIHTRLLPAFWGLPEADMLARRRHVPGLSRLATLDSEGALLHAVVHCTSHLFAHGVKAAWDVCEYLNEGEIDWERLGRWVSQLAAPRAFWTLFNTITHELRLDVPADFLSCSPRDVKQLRLEAIARLRAFSASDTSEELNPFSKNAVFLLLCDSTVARARQLASLLGPEAMVARSMNWRYQTKQSATPLAVRLQSEIAEAWWQWREYRKLVGSAQFRKRVDRTRSGIA
jgi:MoaA/NifB/PqqE/SkfB family radical SAM enzyme